MIESLLTLDGTILLWIQENLRAEWLTPVMVTITKLGGLGFIWIVISLILLCFRKTRWAGVSGLLALVFSLLINNMILKNLFARTRPYEVVEGLQLLTAKATDYSFPSGHAGSSFAAAVAICCTQKEGKARWILLLLAVVMGFSRLYIGIHYPTDVICGAVTGSICGYVSSRMIGMIRKKAAPASI